MLRWVLVLDAIVTGLVYGIGSRGAHHGPVFYYLNQVPGGMRAIGYAYLLAGVLLAAGYRHPSIDVRAHLFAVFIYTLYAAGLIAAYWRGGDPGAGPVHMIGFACMHGVLAVAAARRKVA